MRMMEKMMSRMMGKMSPEEKEKMMMEMMPKMMENVNMMEMMPKMMGMMGSGDSEGGKSKMMGMGSMKSGEMKQMMHETMPRMMRDYFDHMDAEDRKETLTMCRSAMDDIEREFSNRPKGAAGGFRVILDSDAALNIPAAVNARRLIFA